MPFETVQTTVAAMNVTRRLADLRHAAFAAAAAAIVAERKLAYERSRAEQAIYDARNGNVGKNEEERRRLFTIELEKVDAYVDARTSHDEAEADRRLFETDMQLANDQLNILVAALGAGVTEIASEAGALADLFDDRAADESSAILAAFAVPIAHAITVEATT